MIDIEDKILKALQTGVTTAVQGSNIPAFPIKYIGKIFNPPDDGKYIEIVYIPNNINGEFWSSGKTYRGLFRLILHWGLFEQGAYEPLRFFASVTQYFSIGEVFQYSGVSVKITAEPDLTGVIENAPDLMYPLTIRYETFKKA